MAGNLKILLVDDNPMVLGMLRHELAELAPVTTATNGIDAIAAAVEQTPDLIISDYNMPEMDGLGLLRAVRGHPVARKIPFILLTGRGDRELVVKAAQAGANNYLIKPFTADVLRQKIEQVMGKLS